MLVDDDEDDREIFLTLVTKSDSKITVSVASNGQEALDQLKNASMLPELIFLDLNMPLMNGRQFMHVIKADEKLREVPVVILSTSSDRQTISDMLALGAVDFITKPDKFSAWEKMLREFFENPR